jgi:hypothetical protein
MKRVLVNVALWVLASPVLFLFALVRLRRHWQALRVAQALSIPCECGEDISLVGLWRCSCGYTYRGHLYTECPVCGTTPLVARCYRCGVTTTLPEVSP